MKLTDARLCLDCDEVHADDRCPMCASESFAFIKRWVTTPEQRTRQLATNAARTETVETYRALLAATPAQDEPTMTRRLLRGGAVGLAVLGAAGWLLHKTAGENAKTEPGDAPDAGTRKPEAESL
jgi:hypothetical protein